MSSSIDTHEEQQSQVEKANSQSNNDSETSANPPSEDVKLESATESDIDSVDNGKDDQDVGVDVDEDEDEEKGEDEDNSLTHLLKRPNNIPCIGFHKEIIRRDDNPKRIHILIHPPVEHVGLLQDALREARVAAGGEEGDSDNDNVINNAKELSFYLAKIKKEELSLPEGCTKSTFGKFYTKVSSLNEADKKLLAASQLITDNLEKQKLLENMEEDEDESEEEDENALKKFEQEINKNFLVNFHPEITQINFAELNALSKMTRDENGAIIDDMHRTLPFITKYERTRILGIRAKQLNNGAKPFITLSEDMMDGYTIAKQELKEKKIPFIIRRPLPNGASEYWRLEDLEMLR